MHIQVISVLPEMFAAISDFGVTSRALKQGLWQFDAINPRQFADNKLGYIDDRPYGGGPGMVMMAPPLARAIAHAKDQHQGKNPSRVLYLSPQGQPLTHAKTQELAQLDGLILLCGRYEGVDERLLERHIDEEIAVGDFVVSGGELPAMMLMDSVLRQIDGVLGHQDSAAQDSFANGLLDCPHYTRPVSFENMHVPEVLLSGNHAKIAKWREQQSVLRTTQRRPDLLAALKQEASELGKSEPTDKAI